MKLNGIKVETTDDSLAMKVNSIKVETNEGLSVN